MIDREARNEVIQGIDEFMDDQCDSDDLDGLLDLVYDETQDETIKNLRFAIMQTYDFLWPHMIDVDLPKWKFLNRVRLLLQSDAELTVIRCRRWTVRQIAHYRRAHFRSHQNISGLKIFLRPRQNSFRIKELESTPHTIRTCNLRFRSLPQNR